MISVGSFSDKANALSLFKKLLKKGFKSEIKTTSTAMSRVVVLSNCSENELNAMLNKLKSEFNQQAFIVN
jgi:cell division protein FtsN